MPLTLTLAEARKLLRNIQGSCRIEVKRHAYKDHPERRFNVPVLINLVRTATTLITNTSGEAIPGSFKLIVYDHKQRQCQLIVLFEKIPESGEYIIVCSAYRKV